MNIEWINIKDELPQSQEDVLCYSNKNGGYFFIGYLSSNEQYWCEKGFMHCADVLYWCPLDKPIK